MRANYENEVRDILIREIKEYSEQSEYVVKSFFFDAIFSETPICGIVEGLDLSTGWISLNTKMNFSPLNNQISTLKFSMAAILRHFRASESEHHATFSNINTGVSKWAVVLRVHLLSKRYDYFLGRIQRKRFSSELVYLEFRGPVFYIYGK